MIIPSHKLTAYLDTLPFPVEILEERGNRVVRVEDRAGLLGLIEAEAVIGIGSWKRIRHLRLNMPIEQLESLRINGQFTPMAAANKTIHRERLASGHQVLAFDGPRCVAYRGGREHLDFTAL